MDLARKGGPLATCRKLSKIESTSIRHSIGQYGPAQRESRVRFVVGYHTMEL
jgi:hypothetical protein